MKDKVKIIYSTLFLLSFIFLVIITVVFLEDEAKKTKIGLAIMYFIGVLVFFQNIFSFYTKKVMRFRSLTFYYPQDNEIRCFIFFVSLVAVFGFGFAFFSLLFEVL